VLLLAVGLALTLSAAAVAFAAFGDSSEPVVQAPPAFELTWEYIDKPVADQRAQRTWLWGPAPISKPMTEPYKDAPGGKRLVLYYDKARMELSNPTDQTDASSVSLGLLAAELATGRMQTGDGTFKQRQPAEINVAGDPDDPNAPTYATIGKLMTVPPLSDGAPVTQRVARDGTVVDDPALAEQGVTATFHIDEGSINHQIASVFWDFMNSTGIVYAGDRFVGDRLFENPFYATGYPIAEPYWADVKVEGTSQLVLIQCFQRRCLTYTPQSEPQWRVEAGNVGRHYYEWRYGE